MLIMRTQFQKVRLKFTLALGMDQLFAWAEPAFLSGTGQQIGSLLRDENVPRYALCKREEIKTANVGKLWK